MMPHYKNKSVISSATELFQKTQVQSGNKKKKNSSTYNQGYFITQSLKAGVI